MSAAGLAAAAQWDADFRLTFPELLPAFIEDDLPDQTMFTGQLAMFKFWGLRPDGRPWYKIRPEAIPGRASWWHERGHHLYRVITDRTSAGTELLKDGFRVRGADPTLVDRDGLLTSEQWCSLLPEAFIGEWGGYKHPLYDNVNDPVGAAAQISSYFASRVAASVRAFFKTHGTWSPAPSLPAPTADPLIIDVRGALPFQDNIFGTFSPKDSLTFHWNGPPVDLSANPLDILAADAQFHIGKSWGGISYHKAIWTDGTLYITRDMDAVLAACGDAIGNAKSQHVQVMIGTGQLPSLAQWWRMAELARTETNVHPHNYWSGTTCPGPDISHWIAEKGWDEDMTPAQEAKLDRVIALLEAEGPKIWTARAQRVLDVETGKPFNPNTVPQDTRIKT